MERRQASPEEEAQLTAAAEALRDRLAAHGLDIAIVYDRLNRRKVDLIPGVARPAQGGDRRAAAPRQRAARSAPASPASAPCVDLARELCREVGLAHPGITSDIKHVEIGLTDKSDSMRYVYTSLIAQRGRRPQDMIVLGDEFGPIGDSEGSDYLMLIPELRHSVFVSVGVEPNGVPPRVLHLGGGPDAFLRILHDQLALREEVAYRSFPEPTRDPAWRFEVKGFDPFREREVETWLTVANGETGTRGALEEGSAVSTPATFVAGVFGDGTGDPAFRQPVPAPDWTGLRLQAWGSVVNLSNGELVEHERVLDMRHGVVYRYWRQRLRSGHTLRVRTARFASLADRQLLAMRAEATPEDAPGRVMWAGAVGVSHAGGPTRETEFELLDAGGFIARTRGRNGGGHALAVATRPAPGSPVARMVDQGREVIGGRLEPGDPATVDRFAAIVSARTRVPSSAAARRALARAEQLGFDELLRRHRAAWEERWRDADLVVVTATAATRRRCASASTT